MSTATILPPALVWQPSWRGVPVPPALAVGRGRSTPRPSWRDAAACTTADPDLFYSDTGPGREVLDHRAKVVCSGCSVASECFAEAVATGQEFGVWGGLNPRERRTIVYRGTSERDRRARSDAPSGAGPRR